MIGQDLVEKLFPNVDPLDKEVSLGGIPFRVIGVAERVGSAFGQSQDNFAFIPLSTLQSIWTARPELMVFIKAADGSYMKQLEDEVRVLMRVRRTCAVPRARHVRHQRIGLADECME
ncbi:MAG: ABC transporter permease [Ignavibacteriota bacterium]